MTLNQAEQQISTFYERLSREDQLISKSNSVVNQIAYLDYAFDVMRFRERR